MQLVYFDHRGQGRLARGAKETLHAGQQCGGYGSPPPASWFRPDCGDWCLLRRHGGVDLCQSVSAKRIAFDCDRHCPGLSLSSTEQRKSLQNEVLRRKKRSRNAFGMATLKMKRSCRNTLPSCDRSIPSPTTQTRHRKVGSVRFFLLMPSTSPLVAFCAPTIFAANYPKLRLPTLVIGARHDWICPPEFSEEIASAIPNADLRIFEHSGHSIRADEPEALLDAIVGFIVYKR